MAPLGPFEMAPALAVAVSGGRDSMALALLALDWAKARGGTVLGLTVDHDLRRESHAECEQVRVWLRNQGADCDILAWTGPKPTSGIQKAARDARYRLLEEACAARGILHLLLAHHRDDQSETIALRGDRASGRDGLAGIAAIRDSRHMRLLRPLLSVTRARLTATLRVRGQSWIDDPSNADPRFARGRLRQGGLALPPCVTADIAARGGDRRHRDLELAALSGRAIHIDPAGYVWIAPSALRRVPEPLARRLIARCLMAVGGHDYPPRGARLDALLAAIMVHGSMIRKTLAGCVLRSDTAGRLLVAREPGRIAPPVFWPGTAVSDVLWDRRFLWARSRSDLEKPLEIGALGASGLRALPEPVRVTATLPRIVRLGLPCIRFADASGAGDPVAVPHLGYRNGSSGLTSADVGTVRWLPPLPIAGAAFQPMLDPDANA